MAALIPEEFESLLSRGCACGRNHVKVRAIASGRMSTLDGEPVSPAAFSLSPATLCGRAYKVECSECHLVLWERSDCPLCNAPNGLGRVLQNHSGLKAPPQCPDCEHPELKVSAEVRMHVAYVLGRESRKVADAESHEPGFHVSQVDCPSCERTVAKVSGRCVACGRSSLLRNVK